MVPFMATKKTSRPKRKGPKFFGKEKRLRITLTLDPGFVKAAKARAKEEDKSLSLWLEDLGKAALEE